MGIQANNDVPIPQTKGFFGSFISKVVQYSDEQIFGKTPTTGSFSSRNDSGNSSLDSSAISSSNSSSNNISPSKPRSSTILNSSSSSIIPAPYPNCQEDSIAHLTFNNYYSYFHEKIFKLGNLKTRSTNCYKKQKEFAIYEDILNDAIAQFYNETKLIERQYKTAVGDNPKFYNDGYLPSCLFHLQVLYKATAAEAKYQNQLANGLDLHFNLAIANLKKDLNSGKDMLYKRLKTCEKIHDLRKQIDKNNDIVDFKIHQLKAKLESYEQNYKKFNDIGKVELVKSDKLSEISLADGISEFSNGQYRYHLETSRELKSLLERI